MNTEDEVRHILFQNSWGKPKEIILLPRETLLEGLRHSLANLDTPEPCAPFHELYSYLDTPCGGTGICGKCKVIVKEGSSNPLTSEEEKLLTSGEIERGFRLACRLIPEGNLLINLITPGHPIVLEAFGNISETPDPRIVEKEKTGIAVDIGTTTLAIYLIDFSPPARVIDVISGLNAQRVFGADVISRITFAGAKPENNLLLSNTIRTQINRLIAELLRRNRRIPESVMEISIVGNTTMLHLFSGVDPSPLAVAPFTPVFTEELTGKAESFSLSYPNAKVYVLPSLAAYIGADISAGIAAVNIDKSAGLSLFLDLGTNGEIVLGNRNKLLACATAAGPAFEGAGISCGVGGIPGAINRVFLQDGIIKYTYLAEGDPVGLCGSGIMDAIAVLLSLKIIDSTGAMDLEYAKEGYPITENGEGRERLYITQRDIRQFQLAKGAIAAGIRILLAKWSARVEDITEVFLSGGFGNYLNPLSALLVGLLPGEIKNRITVAKNTAGLGAVRYLLFQKEENRIKEILQKTEYIELSLEESFQETFIQQLSFPDKLEGNTT